MRAVILAAGEGTRMRPLTENRPKVMLPIANKPLLEYIIGEVMAAGIRDITLIVGYRQEAVRDYFGDGSRFGVHIDYIVQDKQMGTGHAFGMASAIKDDRFIALNGDIVVSANFIGKLRGRKEVAVIAVKKVADPRAYGVIEVNNDRVTRIVEKSPAPPSNLANAGIYLFSPLIFVAIEETGLSPRGEFEVTDALQYLIDKGKQVGFEPMEEEWLDVGKPWDLLAANEMALKNLRGKADGR
ncbi:MAG TPA: bifunctional sugar-1-phosphate nucleotidylyltransferase/acetyltransferase, partial [Methanocella sp.]|nr:bifunctional sugar-1-phosphate nucleotidylyltransferase/acetyltransferase [Methanocella sp.]